jgi:proteasome lid subunit RPN8/RPN11
VALVVSGEILQEIADRARDRAPEEVCGWLAGRGSEVYCLYPVSNTSESPEVRFEMEPQAQLDAMREIRKCGLEIAGTYHSHPRSPAVPSARDASLALSPQAAHLIISLARPEPEVRAYRITEAGTAELQIVPDRAPATTGGGCN